MTKVATVPLLARTAVNPIAKQIVTFAVVPAGRYFAARAVEGVLNLDLVTFQRFLNDQSFKSQGDRLKDPCERPWNDNPAA